MPSDGFDTSGLLDNDIYNLDDDIVDYESSSLPIKKHILSAASTSCDALSPDKTPDLRCEHTNELFQMTNHLRESLEMWDPEKMLHNDKIEKLLNQLRNDDFELDDQLRTRVFRGRFRRSSPLDELDLQLNAYLREPQLKEERTVNENKENVEPLGIRKGSNSVNKPKRKRMGIPVLQPLANITNLEKARSPKRVCVPRRSTPGKPCLKALDDPNIIYVVDSLTGLVNDATQFGTELNASNCEGFPMPEDINEIVQIPTNDTVPSAAALKKMAIIKAFHSTRFPSVGADNSRGFYSKKQFDEYKNGKLRVFDEAKKKGVQWADDLEW